MWEVIKAVAGVPRWTKRRATDEKNGKKENQCLKEIIFYTKIADIWIHG
jgi:hypothetical protein